jgi:RNA polymerase sigma factor (sigma-70 family)
VTVAALDFPPASVIFRPDPARSPGRRLRPDSTTDGDLFRRPMTRTASDAADVEADRRWSAMMVRAQAGDRTAYENLLQECVPVVERVARRQGVQADRLDDVVQEVLVTVHRARRTYDPNRSFAAWLRTIAQRRAIDALRRRSRQDRREVHAPLAYEAHSDPDANAARGWETAARTKVLGQAVAELPLGQREAVEHLALRELSLDQAAAVTGRTKGALKVNLHRALKTLRSRLGGGG